MSRREHPMMKKFLCLIRDDKNEEFADLLHELKHQLITKALTKHILSYKWVGKLPLYCTLCDRHKMLKQIQSKMLEVHKFQCYASFGLEVHAIDLAKALNYSECEHELGQIYIHGPHENHHACQDHGPQDYQLFEGILKTSKSCIEELHAIIGSVLCRLCHNGYNIRAQGLTGSTPLHAAVVHSAPFDIIRTLVKLGGDMNEIDKFGCSSLIGMCLRKDFYRKDRYIMLKLVKLWLYQNPDIYRHRDIVPDAVSCDRVYHKNPDGVSEMSQSDEAYHSNPDVVSQTNQSDDELYLLPWLYMGGFHITPDDIECDSVNHVTYMLNLNIPRDLKQLARSRIRCTYPGLTLHDTIKRSPLPVSIRDYILMEELNVT